MTGWPNVFRCSLLDVSVFNVSMFLLRNISLKRAQCNSLVHRLVASCALKQCRPIGENEFYQTRTLYEHVQFLFAIVIACNTIALRSEHITQTIGANVELFSIDDDEKDRQFSTLSLEEQTFVLLLGAIVPDDSRPLPIEIIFLLSSSDAVSSSCIAFEKRERQIRRRHALIIPVRRAPHTQPKKIVNRHMKDFSLQQMAWYDLTAWHICGQMRHVLFISSRAVLHILNRVVVECFSFLDRMIPVFHPYEVMTYPIYLKIKIGPVLEILLKFK